MTLHSLFDQAKMEFNLELYEVIKEELSNGKDVVFSVLLSTDEVATFYAAPYGTVYRL